MAERDYSKYKGGGRRKGSSSWVATGPALSEYEESLKNYPGPGKDDSWVVDFLRNAPIPGMSLLLQSPVGKALVGEAEKPIRNILEEGEDAPVIGPALGVMGKGMDLLSRGNYLAANVADEILPENTDDDQGFLEQLGQLWRTGASIPALALPDVIAENLGLRREDVSNSDIARAAWEGLSGKEKATFGQNLRERGVENNLISGIGGFGLDVALDPTTYIGSGVVKGASRAEGTVDDIARAIGGAPDSGFTGLMDIPPRVNLSPADVVSEVPVSIRGITHGPPRPEGMIPGLGNTPMMGDPGLQSLFPRPGSSRFFEPNNPLSPVDEVVNSGISDDFLQGELPFAPDPVQFNEGIGQQINLFDKRRRGVKEALEGVDIGKPSKAVRPVDEASSAIDEALRMGAGSTPMGQLSLAFPEKAEEIKWLQLFDPDMPQHVKKSWKPSVGVELKGLDEAPEPWELESLIDMPARAASDDWEVARQLYLSDGPVDVPVSSLATNGSEGLIKAPYEVAGIRGENFKGILPPHRELMNLSDDGARLAEPSILDLGDVNKPWGKPGSGGGTPKGPRFNPGKLPGAGSAGSKAEGYVALRIAGVDVARSERMYRAGRSLFRPFYYGDGIARTLGKAFNMGAHLPDGLDQMHRVAENTQMAHFDRNMRAVTNHLGKLPLEERRQIGRALADGTNLTEFKPSVISDEFQTGEDYRQLAKGIFDEAWNAEDGQNIAKGPYVDNYFHRQILNEGKLSKEDIKYAKAKNSDGSYKHSVQDLIDRNIEIELDVNKVLVDRLAESARKLTKADFQWQAVARFGIPGKHVTKDMIEKFDLVQATGQAVKGFDGQIYVPKHINESMNWASRMLDSDEESMKFMRHLDRVIGEWKYLALATPGRHVRDIIGDVTMNAQAGVWNPNAYRKASKILGFNTPSRNNIAKIDEAHVMSKVLGQDITPNVGTVSIAGQKVPIEKAWEQLYVQSGAKAGQLSTEVSRMAALPKGRGEVRGGSINIPGRMYAATKRTIGRASDVREDWARLAHLVDFLDRKATKGPIFSDTGDLTSYGKQMVSEAGKSVRKWNIDYGNLTPFERNTMRRIIPFYTFMRHNMPRQLELLFTKPGFMSLYPKGNNLLQGVFGTESGDDTLLPNWIRESAPFRIQHAGQEQKGALGWLLGAFGAQPGQQVLGDPHSFTTPIGDFSMLNAPLHPTDPLGEMAREVGSRLTPALKIPMELMTGNKVFNGAPIGGDYVGYFSEQIPQGRAVGNIFDGGPGAQEGLARMLTGLPIRGVTDQMMDNEAYRRELEAKRLFQDSLSRNLPSQYRAKLPTNATPEQVQAAKEQEREIYRNLMRAQQGGR